MEPGGYQSLGRRRVPQFPENRAMRTRTNLREAQNLLSRGYAVIPIPFKSKRPVITGWQNKRYTAKQLPDRFDREVNIGVLLGEPSDWLIDIDVDHPRAVELASQYLPDTNAIFGRAGKPRSHWLYRVTGPAETRKFQDSALGMIVELRSTGAQTIFPGSTHPSGEPIEWEEDGTPAIVDPDALLQTVSSLAEAVQRECVPKPSATKQTSVPPVPVHALVGDGSRWLEKALAKATGGSRNDVGLWLACQLRDNRVPHPGAKEIMCEYARRVPQASDRTPYTKREALATLHQAYDGRAPREPSEGTRPALPARPEDWPAPLPIPDALPPVLPFDASLLPASFEPWITDVAERMQCPMDFPAIGAMISLAGVVGRKVGIRPKRCDDWLVVPNLWGAIIGRPSAMKSPPLREAMKPLKRLIGQADEAHRDRLAAYQRTDAENKLRRSVLESQIKTAMRADEDYSGLSAELAALTAEPAPVRRRYAVNDCTVEALGGLLAENPNGLIVTRDELIGLLKYLEREGQESARAFYLEGWDGNGCHETDRIGRGNVKIEAVCISLIGTIQPGPLGQYLRGAVKGGTGDDGFIQRFQLGVWPDDPGEWRNVDRWPDTEARDAAFHVFARLDALTAEDVAAERDRFDPDAVPFLRFGPEAQSLFDEWMYHWENALRRSDEHPAIEAHLAKFRSLIPSVALLIHLAENRVGPVDSSALERAIGWSKYLESHARRIYSPAIDPAAASAKTLAKRILAGDVTDGFAARDVYRRHWSDLATKEDVLDAVDFLVDLDWLREIVEPTSGRSRTSYRINPKVRAMGNPHGAEELSAKSARRPYSGPSGTSVTSTTRGSEDSPGVADWPVERQPTRGRDGRPASFRRLDPDTPGPVDQLDERQRTRYGEVYKTIPGGPTEKHAVAWRAAVTAGAGEPGRKKRDCS